MLSVRARLTLWYCALLAVVLVTFATASWIAIAHAIRTDGDVALTDTAHELAAAFGPLAAEEGGLSRRVPLDFRFSDRAIVVFDGEGRVVARSRSPEVTDADVAAIARRVVTGKRGFFAVAKPGGGPGLRALAIDVRVVSAGFVAVVARDLADQERRLHSAALALFAGIPFALVVAGAGGYLLARHSLSPVVRMSRQARRIGASSLDERIAVEHPGDELGVLAETLNGLFERLQSAFSAQRRFMADASHELRTPLSILQTESDVALSRTDRDAAEYRDALDVVQKTSQKLSQIVEDLFLVSRSDAGDYPVRRGLFYLDETIADASRAMRTRAEAHGVRIEIAATPERLASGDEELIHRLVLNLLDNAVKHSREGGCVRLELSDRDGLTTIAVRDEGPGVAPADRDRIFERFYRGSGKQQRSDGAGLGLAIVKSIAQMHGGDARLAETSAAGSTFVAELRLTPNA